MPWCLGEMVDSNAGTVIVKDEFGTSCDTKKYECADKIMGGGIRKDTETNLKELPMLKYASIWGK